MYLVERHSNSYSLHCIMYILNKYINKRNLNERNIQCKNIKMDTHFSKIKQHLDLSSYKPNILVKSPTLIFARQNVYTLLEIEVLFSCKKIIVKNPKRQSTKDSFTINITQLRTQS